MEPFTYEKATDATKLAAGAGTQLIAGGTTLVDLMRLGVMRPTALVDITALPFRAIEPRDGGVRIGALVTNTQLAEHAHVRAKYPVLREALLSGASPQLRNVATVGGNLLQRTRCPYFRDPGVAACNKRAPGSGCAALGGFQRSHAVLGTSAHCIATNPSDLNVALAALDAVVHVQRGAVERALPFATLHTLPGEHPEIETVLAPGDLITHVELPALPVGARSTYRKVRDRAAFAFALASAAVVLVVEGGAIAHARIGLGGLATKPWRSPEAEAVLVGQPATPAQLRRAAEAALAGAKVLPGNEFKVELAKRTLVRALGDLVAGGAP